MKKHKRDLFIDIFQAINIRKLSDLDEYLKGMRSYIEKEQREYINFLNEEEKKFSEDNPDDFINAYIDDYKKVTEEFPEMFYSSYILLWYSMLENCIIGICEGLSLKVEIGVSDRVSFRGGICDTHKFLKKAIGYEWPEDLRTEFCFITNLRHKIAHGHKSYSLISEEGGQTRIELDGDNYSINIEQNLYKYLNDNAILRNSGMMLHIAPNATYCEMLLALGKKYLIEISNGLKSNIMD